MKTFSVQITLRDLISFQINAESIEEAIKLARLRLNKTVFYQKNIEVLDTEQEITGIYE